MSVTTALMARCHRDAGSARPNCRSTAEFTSDRASLKAEAERKPGRPRKYKGGRIHATVRFTPERHASLKAEADRNGRSVSEQVEAMVERAVAYDQMLEAIRTSVAEIERGAVEGAFRRAGYMPVSSRFGRVWYPPGFPMEGSGFITEDESDQPVPLMDELRKRHGQK
jgi:predicted HicB family RNase H-like nuclease